MSPAALGFSLLAVLCWGVWVALDKALLARVPTHEAFVSQYYALLLLMAPFMVLGFKRCRAAYAAGGTPALTLLAAGVVAMTLGSYFYFRALSLGEASRVGPLTSVYPLVSFFLACAWLGESFTAPKLAGTALVVTGTALLAR